MKTIIIWFILIVSFFILSTTAVTGFLNVKADMAKHNGTYGKIRYVDVYEDFDAFNLELNDTIFYKNANGGYSYKKEFGTVIKFNGTDNKYNLLVNSSPCNLTMSTAGQLYGVWKHSFDDLNGNFVCVIVLNIRFTFSTSKITLTIDTDVSEQNFGYLVQYINVNGFKLRIIDEQYNTAQTAAALNFELKGAMYE